MKKQTYSKLLLLWLSVTILSLPTILWGQLPPAGEPRWFKGNTHCHSWWSDGDSPPEIVADWYKKNGYHFLVISDHNTLNEGKKWYEIKGKRAETLKIAAKKYEDTYGPDWVKKRVTNNQTQYHLKTLNEYRTLFEEPGKFLLIPGEEITTSSRDGKAVHVNGINLKDERRES